ncbi:hypothetical protein GA0070617_2597 [Micromonospora yangpuensis]|uniref:Phosphotransferase enzyme family protein n=1 Tax=Micromonospora yangpuensis TaxID=683228 RepID=A0A1C6UJP6_9ACTN|nr:hypothetical protein GA0070617_2597 [Micromonospora yangpuensis]
MVGAHLEKVAARFAAALGRDASAGVVHGDFIGQNLVPLP